MDATLAATALVALQRKSVLVIGDVMLDRFIDGSVSRISPEAPVPVLEKSRETEVPGGAANVASNLASLGCEVRLVSVTGDDPQGRAVASLLGANMAIDFHQIIDRNRPTTTKTRFRADGQQVLRFDEEVTGTIDGAVSGQVLDTFAAALTGTDLVVLSDYAKGAVPPALIATVIAMSKDAGKTVVVDPKLADFSVYAGASLLTPNLAELRKTGIVEGDTLEQIAAGGSKLAADHDLEAMLVTLSARGMLLAGADGSWHHTPAQTREVFDVSGAGDTVIAMMAAALASGITRADAMSLANIAASVVVAKSGTAIASPGEIIDQAGATTPQLDWPHWAAACQTWRDAGQTVGFANGCFDLLHPGHMFLLQNAAAQCDRLIVGVNSDASVRRLKGDGRPAQSAERRAATMIQLPFIDGVAIFEEDTPLELIKALQPDFIFKGGDYRPGDVVGADIVEARGGGVRIIPTLGNHSSTGLISG